MRTIALVLLLALQGCSSKQEIPSYINPAALTREAVFDGIVCFD